jgi:protein SCO1
MVRAPRGVLDDMAADPPPTPPEADPPDDDRRSRWRALAPLLVIVLVLGIVTAVFASRGGHKDKLPGNVTTAKSAGFAGAVATPAQPAPALRLRDARGAPFDLAADRGHVVLVTFLYVHCPDICPLIAANLKNTLDQLGAASRQVRVVAVSVDPRGDTPRSVASFLDAHGLTGRMRYLVGSAARLGRVWKAWNVGSQRDTADPEAVAHSALVYGISARGLLTTLYPANFRPADVVHDVPGLLAS